MPDQDTALLNQLAGGDRRSIGRANEVAEAVSRQPDLFSVLIDGMTHADPVVRMRAADAAEKVSKTRPELLVPVRDRLVALAEQSTQQEVRWHLAQMLPRVSWGPSERAHLFSTLMGYMTDSSAIVRTTALAACFELAAGSPDLEAAVRHRLQERAANGSAAERSRARKLLAGPRRNLRGTELSLDAYFEGQATSRVLFEAVKAHVATLEGTTFRATKSQVALRRRRGFAWVWRPDDYLHGQHAPLVLTIDLPRRDPSPRWKEVVEPRPGRFTHHLELREPGDVDAQVEAWLAEAWATAG